MSAEITSEIRSHFESFTGERMSFLSAHHYEGHSLTVTFLKFKSELGLMSVISLELRDSGGHSVKQDLLMEEEAELKSKISGKDFNDDLVKRLKTLNEALKEMN